MDAEHVGRVHVFPAIVLDHQSRRIEGLGQPVVRFQVRLLEYWDEQGQFHYHDWDENAGFIGRSKRFDTRNQGEKLGFTSLIIDAIKPG